MAHINNNKVIHDNTSEVKLVNKYIKNKWKCSEQRSPTLPYDPHHSTDYDQEHSTATNQQTQSTVAPPLRTHHNKKNTTTYVHIQHYPQLSNNTVQRHTQSLSLFSPNHTKKSISYRFTGIRTRWTNAITIHHKDITTTMSTLVTASQRQKWHSSANIRRCPRTRLDRAQ